MPIVDDDAAEKALAEARARIRKNFPRVHAPLNWRRVSKNMLTAVGQGKTYYVDKHGEGDATRYRARIHPQTVLGDRLMTAEQAKELCERDASPLDLTAASGPSASPGPSAPIGQTGAQGPSCPPGPSAPVGQPGAPGPTAMLPPDDDRPDWLKDDGEVTFEDLEDPSWRD